uniref:Uncharacterized protein n=1 Tax=Rhizophora mucronata TaxID=61149 RepID=A0A2P2JL00_RHIMU
MLELILGYRQQLLDWFIAGNIYPSCLEPYVFFDFWHNMLIYGLPCDDSKQKCIPPISSIYTATTKP